MNKPDPSADDRLFAALADPTRRAILRRLLAGPMSVHDVAALFDVSRPAISKHLDVLRAAGLVSVTPQGRERVHTLTGGEAGGRLAAWSGLLTGATAASGPASRSPQRRAKVALAGSEFEVWRRRA